MNAKDQSEIREATSVEGEVTNRKLKSGELTSRELDAVNGGAFNAFANFGDIKGESDDSPRTRYSKTLTFTLSTTQP
jgi:hypothetical protein